MIDCCEITSVDVTVTPLAIVAVTCVFMELNVVEYTIADLGSVVYNVEPFSTIVVGIGGTNCVYTDVITDPDAVADGVTPAVDMGDIDDPCSIIVVVPV